MCMGSKAVAKGVGEEQGGSGQQGRWREKSRGSGGGERGDD